MFRTASYYSASVLYVYDVIDIDIITGEMTGLV